MSPTTPVVEFGLLAPIRRLLLERARGQPCPRRTPHNIGAWRWRILAGLALLAAVLILARVPGIAHDLNGELTPSIWRGWLAGILDMFGNLWNSMTPVDQGLLMVTAGALIVLSGGTLGVAFEVGVGMALLGSAHDAARFVRDPKGTAAGYVSSHTPAEMVLDAAAWVAAMAGVFGGVARYGRQAAQESRRWNQAEKAARGIAGPRAAHADPRRGGPDNGAMWRAQQGSGYGGGQRKAQPEPKPAQTPNWGDPAIRHKWYTSLRTQRIRSNSPAYVYQHRVLGTDIEREIVADDGTKVFADAVTPDGDAYIAWDAKYVKGSGTSIYEGKAPDFAQESAMTEFDEEIKNIEQQLNLRATR